MAKEMGLVKCAFNDLCDFCEEPESSEVSWVDICETQAGSEASYYICQNCLPQKYQTYLAELEFWNKYDFDSEMKRVEEQWPKDADATGRVVEPNSKLPDVRISDGDMETL